MPIIALVFAAVSRWITKSIASIVAKIGLTTFQSILSGAVIALQIVIALAFANLIFLLFNTIQDFLDKIFDLPNSASQTVSTALSVVQSVGVWDGFIDSLTLLLPFFTTILVIKLSMIAIKLLRALSNQAHKVINTALSYGI